jgi:hypothetical protein
MPMAANNFPVACCGEALIVEGNTDDVGRT